MVDAVSGQKIPDKNFAAKVAASSRLVYADINRHRRGTAIRVGIMVILAGLSTVTNESARWGLGPGLAFLIVWTILSQVGLIRRKRKLMKTAEVNGWDLQRTS